MQKSLIFFLRYDSIVPTMAKIVEYLHATGFQNPVDKSPFEYAYSKDLWSWVGSDTQRQTDMMDYMAGRRKGGIRWVDVFQPESLFPTARTGEEDVLFVDVGGNQGHDLQMFQERRGKLPGRLILQDLPEVVKKHEKPLEGIEVMAYDFFITQPIKGSYISNRHIPLANDSNDVQALKCTFSVEYVTTGPITSVESFWGIQ